MISSAPPIAPLRTRIARASALALAATAVLAGSLAVTSPASAHDRLVSSDPAADSTVETLPDQLVLVYSAELLDVGGGTAVEVEAPSGASVSDGEAVLEGTDVLVPLAEGTEAGEYTVTWRVVSSDGHPIDGSFGFTVESAAPSQDGAAEDEAPGADEAPVDEAPGADEAPVEEDAASDDTAADDGQPATETGDADTTSSSLPWILGGIAALLAIGAATAAVIVKTRRGAPGLGGGATDDSDATPGDDDAPRGR